MRSEKPRGFFGVPDNSGCVVLRQTCSSPIFLGIANQPRMPHNNDCETRLEPHVCVFYKTALVVHTLFTPPRLYAF